ncbi:MFS transporter, partial [Mesorhizobium sp. M1A.T.Ca.IN.004.03.1.1]
QAADPSELGHLDVLSLLLMATALTSLELSLKEAPTSGWTSAYVLGLLALCLASGGAFIGRTLYRSRPIVDLGNFGDRNFL